MANNWEGEARMLHLESPLAPPQAGINPAVFVTILSVSCLILQHVTLLKRKYF